MHRRMRSVGLRGRRFARPEQVVGWLGAVQSQDYGPAKWAVAERSTRARDTDIDRAMEAGSILRTHVLRPTWHFVLPADIRWMLELTGPRVHAVNGYAYRLLGLDEQTLAKGTAVLADCLGGGNQLTRKQVAAVLAGAGLAADGPRLGYLLMNAELNGVICSGALSGRQQTYALLDERVPEQATMSRDEALAELTRRYYTSHGPATVKDFRWWSSLTVADIDNGLAMVGSQLAHEDVDGVTYWSSASASKQPRRTASAAADVHLLQGYDEYIVGYSESKHLLDHSGAASLASGSGVAFNGVLLLDSQVVGRWKRTITKGSVLVEVGLYVELDDAETAALRQAADRYGVFVGLPVRVRSTLVRAT